MLTRFIIAVAIVVFVTSVAMTAQAPACRIVIHYAWGMGGVPVTYGVPVGCKY